MKRMLVFLAVSLLVCGMTEAAPKWRYYWIEAVWGEEGHGTGPILVRPDWPRFLPPGYGINSIPPFR